MKRPYALKIDDQWRICFHWAGGDAFEVEVCDYHRAMKPTFPHPGTLLREEFLEPMGITPYRVTKETGVRLTRITAILNGTRSVTADTGLRLDRYFGLSEGYWSGLQHDFDVRMARRTLGSALERIRPHTPVEA